jgi:hypothetical protein
MQGPHAAVLAVAAGAAVVAALAVCKSLPQVQYPLVHPPK